MVPPREAVKSAPKAEAAAPRRRTRKAALPKVIIQIPCLNEEKTLPGTLAELPRELAGVGRVEWLVVNDGSTDGTVEVAREHGVDHIVDLDTTQGLARAFMAGMERCLAEGADIIVHTDADNQYAAADIPSLLAPIREGRAEMVVGARPIRDIEEFSALKKRLQRLGSWVVRSVSGTDIPDATSGFRAFSRRAALRLNVFNDYTYTLETIIQAGQVGIPTTWVPVRVNPQTRQSRLIRSIPDYIKRSVITIFRIYLIYKPLRMFAWLGSLPFALGFLLCLRWLWLYLEGTDRAHVPSLVLAAILVLMGFNLWILGLVGETTSANRKLLEDIQLQQRRTRLDVAEKDM